MGEKNDVQLADNMAASFEKLETEISKKIVGQKEVIRLICISIFCKSHSLLVGVPGLAKTLLIKTVSEALSLDFNRIQFTPDLMPSDILGSETLDKDRNLRFIKGPVFSNIILADEINRTPPKTQAALLEAMQEGKVTLAGKEHELEPPFFVLATQNPIEQEGTYPLPEAQLDRFMFMINLNYPSFEEEVEIIKNTTSEIKETISKTLTKEEILSFQDLLKRIPVTDNVYQYVVNLVAKTRPHSDKRSKEATEYLEWGAGPRAGQFLVMGAKCNAILKGKYSPDIEDVKEIAVPILSHRIIKNFKAEAEGLSVKDLIEKML